MRIEAIQISLRICDVGSEASLGAFRIAKDAKFLHSDNEDSGQTARKHMLIWVCWTHMSEGTFPHVAAQIINY